MAIELNGPALRHARALVREGEVVRDERDDWSEAAPTPDEENAFIERDGWTAYSHWHLGVDRDENSETKGAYSFPFGDFRRGYLIVDRQGVRVLRDPYSAKPYVLFYTTKRVGGGVQDFDAIKLMKFAAS